MRKAEGVTNAARSKANIQEWYSFEQPCGEILQDGKFFFALKDGYWLGTYKTHEEAMESLLMKQKADKAEYQI